MSLGLALVVAAPPMPDLSWLETIGGLSATSLFVLAIYALYTRRVRTASEAAEIEARHERAVAELRADRDAWRLVAEGYGTHFAKLLEAVERITPK